MVFDFNYFLGLFPQFVEGLIVSMKITLLSFTLALLLALIIILLSEKNIFIVNCILKLYVSFFRGTPVIAQMFFIYFGLPRVIPRLGQLTAFSAAVITISMNMSSYISENLRGALLSVDKGQIEAACSIGMKNYQVFSRIVLPQAIRVAVPPLMNNLVMTLKGTAVAFTIGVTELMAVSKIEASNTYRYFENYAAVMVVYWIITLVITFFQKRLETKMNEAY